MPKQGLRAKSSTLTALVTTGVRERAHFWLGDQMVTWDAYDGLQAALKGLITGGISGIPLNHSDIGGYTSISALTVGFTRELNLLERWTELNTFSPAFRTHEGNQPGQRSIL